MAISRGLLSERHVRYGISLLAVSGFLVLASAAGFADPAQAPLSAKAKQGAALFQQHCITCHNKQPGDASPFGPPNLHGIFGDKPLVKTPVTPQQAVQIIKKGWSPMPPFGGVLSNAQIDQLIAFLKTQ